jgi:hypothetical protein
MLPSCHIAPDSRPVPHCALLQADFDPNYIHYACVTGTVEHGLHSTQGDNGDAWVKFTMKVPTPNSQSFTQ